LPGAPSVLAQPDAYSVDGASLAVGAPGLLSNDQWIAGTRIALSLPAAHGQIRLEVDGSFAYTADPGFYGLDRFQYELISPTGQTSLANVDVNVALILPGGGVLRDPRSDPFTVSNSSGSADFQLTSSDLVTATFEWLVPSVALTVPGVLLVGIILAQGAGALVWLPLIRRFRRGMTWRRAAPRA
jgi:hypothetical protein